MVLCKRKPVIYTPLPPLSHPSLASLLPPPASPDPTASPAKPAAAAPKGKGKKAAAALGPSDEEKEQELLRALESSAAAVNGGGPGHRGANKQVECWYIPQTGEVFLDYESYSHRIHFYRLPLFQCEVTGRSSLTFFEAFRSEQAEARKLNARLPEAMQKAVLGAVQFQMEGRIDDLAERIFDRFRNRYFAHEKILVDVSGEKYLATVLAVIPPKHLSALSADDMHPFARKLDLTAEEVLEQDNPEAYEYKVQLVGWHTLLADAERQSGAVPGPVEPEPPAPERIMTVSALQVSRDRLNFSKAILKRFMKESVVRDSAAYSPWVVKAPLAKRFAIPTEMSEDQTSFINSYKEAKMEQRKRGREDKEGPNKRQKGDEKQLRDELRAKDKLEKEREDDKPNVNGKRKKPTKYPAEDLLVEITAKEREAGRSEERPLPVKDLPFGESFEKFLTTWSFLNVLGAPLSLSPFTIDEFEQALYQSDPQTPCSLIAEIHACLINVLVQDIAAGQSPVRPLADYGPPSLDDASKEDWEGEKGATVEMIQPHAEDCALSWSKQQLSYKDGRKGWESALVGCLWERASRKTHPEYLDIILHLLFQDQPPPNRPTWATANAVVTPTSQKGFIIAKPEKRYPTLHSVYKLNTLAFLCELAVQTKAARDFMEDATVQLTATRNVMLEVRRELRRVREAIGVVDPKESTDGVELEGEVPVERAPSATESVGGTGTGTGTERDELEESANGHSDAELSDAQSEGSRPATHSRRRVLADKQAAREAEINQKKQQLAKNLQQSRLKKAESKQQLNDRKKLTDELETIIKRERETERDFRAHYHALRARPMGQDRFCNRIWWMDGMGSSPIVTSNGQITYGTGRLYLQGAPVDEIELVRQSVFFPTEELDEWRDRAEGEGRLAPGEWAAYDDVEQLNAFKNWLNPKGVRENRLLRELAVWWPELEGGMLKRHAVINGDDEPIKRSRRQTAEGRDGVNGWRNRRAEGAK